MPVCRLVIVFEPYRICHSWSSKSETLEATSAVDGVQAQSNLTPGLGRKFLPAELQTREQRISELNIKVLVPD